MNGATVNAEKQKLVQYLGEAQASERGLVRELQAQIAMTPRGRYRTSLERHLQETRDHADRVGARRSEIGGADPIGATVALAESAVAQTLALGRTPLNMIRGTGGEEKVLKNAKDAAATEALEIATYTAIERLAQSVGDRTTARLAASIRGEEERMLERILDEIPGLTDKVVGAEIEDEPSYDITETGAADALRDAGTTAKRSAARAQKATRRTARQARKAPGVARAEGLAKGAVASAGDLPIAQYDSLNADDITARLPSLSQIDLAKIESYERRGEKRVTILSRIEALRADEPWPGYDEQNADEIRSALSTGDEGVAEKTRAYERAHKNRAGVLDATERELSRT
jgi:ferritin-like metal-binding protein YciE